LSERESYGCEKDNYQEQNKFIEQVWWFIWFIFKWIGKFHYTSHVEPF
jgi:hypothetical protein